MPIGVSRSMAAANLRRYEDRVARMNEQVNREREESRIRAQRHQDIQRGSIARRQAEQEAELAGRGSAIREFDERRAEAESQQAQIEAQRAEDANMVWEFTPHNTQRRASLMAAAQKLEADPSFNPESKAAGLQRINEEMDAIKKTPRQRTSADGPRYPEGRGPMDQWKDEHGNLIALDRNDRPRVLVPYKDTREGIAEKLAAERTKLFDANAFKRREFEDKLRAETVTTGVKIDGQEQELGPKFSEFDIRVRSERLYPLNQEEFEERYPRSNLLQAPDQLPQGPTAPLGEPIRDEPVPQQEPPEVQRAREVLESPQRLQRRGLLGGIASGNKEERDNAEKVIEQWEKGVAEVDEKLPVVTSDADWKKLTPGTRFRDSEGIEWVKN